jgi:hypothetical protein
VGHVRGAVEDRGLAGCCKETVLSSRVSKEILEPILRLLNLQLRRERCSRLERFSTGEKIYKNALCYLLRCKFLQLWCCNSRS